MREFATRQAMVVFAAWMLAVVGMPASAVERHPGWKAYTNGRFGFSVQYPPDWRVGDPLRDGIGVTLFPPQPNTQVALSGFLNVSEGTSQDGRQTLAEFAAAHRRIINELYTNKKTPIIWEKDHDVTLGGHPAKQLTFSYDDEGKTKFLEMHIFSLGRNEGRGVRIKFPAEYRKALMPVISQLLQTYQPGRDQNAVTPFASPLREPATGQ